LAYISAAEFIGVNHFYLIRPES